jgi:hypothetical protein
MGITSLAKKSSEEIVLRFAAKAHLTSKMLFRPVSNVRELDFKTSDGN